MSISIGTHTGGERGAGSLRERRENREQEKMNAVFKKLQENGARLTWEFDVYGGEQGAKNINHVTGYFSNSEQRDAAKKTISELSKNLGAEDGLTLSMHSETGQRDFLIKEEGQDSNEEEYGLHALEIDFPETYDYKNFLALAKKQPELARQFLTDLAETIAQNAAEKPLENNLEKGAPKTFERIQGDIDAQESSIKDWISGAMKTFFDTANLLGNIDAETTKILADQIHDHADPAYQELIKKIQIQKNITVYPA